MNFSSLVTRSIQENNIKYIKQLPKELLGSNELELVNYIENYVTEWGDGNTLPTKELVVKNVESANYLLTEFPSEESLDKIYAETKRKLINKIIKQTLLDANTQHDNEELDVDEFTKQLEYYARMNKRSTVVDVDDTEFDIYKTPTNKINFKYKAMNDASGGLLGGELALLVARPKVGKTWVLLDNAIDAVRNGKKVYFSSLEMNYQQVAHRVHSLVGGFNPRVFREGTLEDLEIYKERFKIKKQDWYKNNGIFLTPNQTRLTLDAVRADVERIKPDVVYLDSVYAFVGKNGKPIGDDWGAIMNMIAQLKATAMELDIPLVCSTQLKRGVEGADAELDDIAFGDSFGQFADLIVNLYKHTSDGKQVIGLNFLAARHVDPTIHFFLTVDYENMIISEHVSPLFKKYVKDDD